MLFSASPEVRTSNSVGITVSILLWWTVVVVLFQNQLTHIFSSYMCFMHVL